MLQKTCAALGENAVSRTCKKQFQTGNFDSNDAKRPEQPKKWKMKNWNKF